MIVDLKSFHITSKVKSVVFYLQCFLLGCYSIFFLLGQHFYYQILVVNKTQKNHLIYGIDMLLTNHSRATLKYLVGHIWPAGRKFPIPDLCVQSCDHVASVPVLIILCCQYFLFIMISLLSFMQFIDTRLQQKLFCLSQFSIAAHELFRKC